MGTGSEEHSDQGDVPELPPHEGKDPEVKESLENIE